MPLTLSLFAPPPPSLLSSVGQGVAEAEAELGRVCKPLYAPARASFALHPQSHVPAVSGTDAVARKWGFQDGRLHAVCNASAAVHWTRRAAKQGVLQVPLDTTS
eukprot:798741-Rhodomonas_salina.1